MSEKVIRLATSGEPPKKACGTCRFSLYQGSSTQCSATGTYAFLARHDACADGKLWQPRPPRRGAIRVLKEWLFGEPT